MATSILLFLEGMRRWPLPFRGEEKDFQGKDEGFKGEDVQAGDQEAKFSEISSLFANRSKLESKVDKKVHEKQTLYKMGQRMPSGFPVRESVVRRRPVCHLQVGK